MLHIQQTSTIYEYIKHIWSINWSKLLYCLLLILRSFWTTAPTTHYLRVQMQGKVECMSTKRCHWAVTRLLDANNHTGLLLSGFTKLPSRNMCLHKHTSQEAGMNPLTLNCAVHVNGQVIHNLIIVKPFILFYDTILVFCIFLYC